MKLRFINGQKFTLDYLGGGFEALLLEVVHEEHTHDMTTEFRIINRGTGSAPRNLNEIQEPAILEVSIQDLSSDSPSEAVAIMEARGLSGGSNGCSGALSWHFDTTFEAIEHLTQQLKSYGGERKDYQD